MLQIRETYYISWLLIILMSMVGDQLFKLPRYDNDLNFWIDLADTWIHGCIAFLSWVMFIIVRLEFVRIQDVFGVSILREPHISMFFAVFIDLDQFIAGSLQIDKTLNIRPFPFMHNTLFMLALVGIVWSLRYCRCYRTFRLRWFRKLPFVLLNAVIVHHFRDALRHGFNLYPLPSTDPIGLGIYYGVVFVCPFLFCRILGRQDYEYLRVKLPREMV